MTPEEIEAMFGYSPPVDEQLEDTKPLEHLGASATSFAHDLAELLTGKPLRDALVKLQSVVQVAADGIRERARRRDRAQALSAKADAAELRS